MTSLLLPAARAQNAAPLTRHAFTNDETFVMRVDDKSLSGVRFDVSGFLGQTVAAKDGAAEFRFDTSLLRAGDYDVRAQPLVADKPSGAPKMLRISIAPPRNPQRMPVWNWFGAETPDLDWWTARGFNGFRFGVVRDPLVNGSSANTIARILDDGTRRNLDMGAYLYPTLSTKWAAEDESKNRVLKLNGERDPKKPYPLEPEVLDYGKQVAKSWADRFAPFPSWDQALMSSEYYVPFALNDAALTDAKAELGIDLREVFKKEYSASADYAVFDPTKLPAQWQPKNGIIEDDNLIYRVLDWWWTRGSGLTPLNAQMSGVLKAQRPDVQTWNDPYRLAAVHGSHQGLDIISTWTYGHPDIKRLAYATVLQAAARPTNQKVMPNITLFVYKRFVQPVGDSTANLEMDSPGDDPFFTQGPDYTREAMWLTFAQRPDLMAFYYGGTLRPDLSNLDPDVAAPETFDAIGEVSRSLIEPYGPVVLQSQRQKARVAVLMSAAASWFYGPNKAPGYANEAILPVCSLLLMNHVPFEVVLDDDIAAGRLSEFDALVIPRGDTLRRSDYDKIVAFAKAGKTVIAEGSLRAPIAGAKILDLDFGFQQLLDGSKLADKTGITADEFREKNEALAAKIAPLLAPFTTAATSNSPRVLLTTLESGTVRYVFAVNDNKTYGPRFGPWKLFHELGVRQKTQITLPNATGAVYDALSRAVVTPKNGAFDTTLAASRGKLFAVLPEPLGKIEITAPKTATRGKSVAVSARVLGVSGQPIAGSLPLQIEIFDANGDKHPASRYGATVGPNWTLTQKLSPALNDAPGNWTIRVTEMLRGSSVEAKVAVN